ncbi:MAG: hypothetical protein ABIP12_02870, partial [Terriglobales bacterium]
TNLTAHSAVAIALLNNQSLQAEFQEIGISQVQADLHAIRFALHGMEGRGQTECDCSAAGLSAQEPLRDLRQLCHEWKKPFRAAYSAGANFKQLVAVRTAVEKAFAAPAPIKKEEIPVAEAATALLEAAAKSVQSVPVVKAAPVAKAVAAAVSPAKSAVPAAKPAPKPAAPAKAPAAPEAPAALTLEACLEQIATQLINTAPKAAPVTNVVIGTTKLLLASWEVAAFVRGGDDVSDSLQRAVAARALLNVQVAAVKADGTADLMGAIDAAHLEAAQLQELIAEAKDAKNIDAAVNLAASAKRLLGAIDEAEKLT